MQRGDVISERGGHTSQPAGESSDLERAPVDLSREVYLSVEDATRYVKSPSIAAFRQWAYRAGLPKCYRGRRVLYFRRDLDAAVSPEYLKPTMRVHHKAPR